MLFEQAGEYILTRLRHELPGNLPYHSVQHVEDVYSAAEFIGKKENISDHEMKLLLTAAWYHDAGFIFGAENHEETSCRIAEASLPQFEYPTDTIEKICGMIMATKIPQLPKNHLEEILADADLDYLGRDDFFPIAEKLFRELTLSGHLQSEEEWNQLQVHFLENHRYFTETALQLRQVGKEAHLKQIKAKLTPTPQ
jgi:predicted metal-dependent HD superfamily phosphohydrolase